MQQQSEKGAGCQVASTSWLYAAAGLSTAAGVVHLLVTPEHFEEWIGYGLFFLIAGLTQMLFAGYMLRQPANRALLLAGVASNTLIVALWVVTRTAGIPIGPAAGEVEAMTWQDTVPDGSCSAVQPEHADSFRHHGAVDRHGIDAAIHPAPRATPPGVGGVRPTGRLCRRKSQGHRNDGNCGVDRPERQRGCPSRHAIHDHRPEDIVTALAAVVANLAAANGAPAAGVGIGMASVVNTHGHPLSKSHPSHALAQRLLPRVVLVRSSASISKVTVNRARSLWRPSRCSATSPMWATVAAW